jgi:hypothetical protein
MTTLRPPSLVAVRLTVPEVPLSFCSTSFALTVVSAAALIGRHSMAEAAVNTTKLRNVAIRFKVSPRESDALRAPAVYIVNVWFKAVLQQTSHLK